MYLAFVSALMGGFSMMMGSLIGRALLALGMGYVTYKGFDVAVGWLLTQIKSNMAGLPSEIVNFMAFLWVDKAIGLVFSAYAAAAGIRMAGGTSMTKLVTKG